MDPVTSFEILRPFISANRLNLIEQKLLTRTRYLTVLPEDIYQPHNAAAVLRSAECFGLQDVHLAENRNSFNPGSQVLRGAAKWLTIHHHGKGPACVAHAATLLKEQGYQIIAATPGTSGHSAESLNLGSKTALVIGTEKLGISDELGNLCDGAVSIATVGFTESLNLSVAAAILLHRLSERVRQSHLPWQLNDSEKSELRFNWACAMVKDYAQILNLRGK